MVTVSVRRAGVSLACGRPGVRPFHRPSLARRTGAGRVGECERAELAQRNISGACVGPGFAAGARGYDFDRLTPACTPDFSSAGVSSFTAPFCSQRRTYSLSRCAGCERRQNHTAPRPYPANQYTNTNPNNPTRKISHRRNRSRNSTHNLNNPSSSKHRPSQGAKALRASRLYLTHAALM